MINNRQKRFPKTPWNIDFSPDWAMPFCFYVSRWKSYSTTSNWYFQAGKNSAQHIKSSMWSYIYRFQGDTEKAMTPHSSTLAWKIPWAEEPGRLQSMGSRRVTSLSLFTFLHWRRKWQPTPGESSCLENPRDGGAWWAAVYGVAQGRTWLKWLSSSLCVS